MSLAVIRGGVGGASPPECQHAILRGEPVRQEGPVLALSEPRPTVDGTRSARDPGVFEFARIAQRRSPGRRARYLTLGTAAGIRAAQAAIAARAVGVVSCGAADVGFQW